MNPFRIMALAPLVAACSTFSPPAAGPGTTVTLTETTPTALVYLVTWPAPDGHDTQAGVVLPKAADPGPEILYFHQLGHGRDWNQFLEEAVQAAAQGVRSVLIDGEVPWSRPFEGDVSDQEKISGQMSHLRRAVDLLASLPGVDQTRLGFVGHDYGAMYGALLSAEKTPLSRFVLITPAPTWETWISFFQHYRDKTKGYAAAMIDWDPLTKLTANPPDIPRLIQLSRSDQYLTADDQTLWKAAGKAAVLTTLEGSSHDGAAKDGAAERQKWLYQPWGLPPPGPDVAKH